MVLVATGMDNSWQHSRVWIIGTVYLYVVVVMTRVLCWFICATFVSLSTAISLRSLRHSFAAVFVFHLSLLHYFFSRRYFVYLSVSLYIVFAVAVLQLCWVTAIMVYLLSICTTKISCSSAFVLRGFEFLRCCFLLKPLCNTADEFLDFFRAAHTINFAVAQFLFNGLWNKIHSSKRLLVSVCFIGQFCVYSIRSIIEEATVFRYRKLVITIELNSKSLRFNDWTALLNRGSSWRIAIKHFINIDKKHIEKRQYQANTCARPNIQFAGINNILSASRERIKKKLRV